MRNGARMRLKRGLLLSALWLLACGGTFQDPVVYVDNSYCPDDHGNAGPSFPWTRQIAGYSCCSDQALGGGQCPEGTSCMLPDGCSSPLPENEFAPERAALRSGLSP